MLLVLIATACLPTPSPTAGDAPYIWQGWVYGDFPSQDAPGLETGTVRLWAMDPSADPSEWPLAAEIETTKRTGSYLSLSRLQSSHEFFSQPCSNRTSPETPKE